MNLELKKLIKMKIWFRNIIESHGLGEHTQRQRMTERRSWRVALWGHSQIKSDKDRRKASKKTEKEDP